MLGRKIFQFLFYLIKCINSYITQFIKIQMNITLNDVHTRIPRTYYLKKKVYIIYWDNCVAFYLKHSLQLSC